MTRSFVRVFTVGVILLAAVASAKAADFLRNEIFGAAGIGKTYDDEGSLGSGLNGGCGYGYRFSRWLGVQAEVNAFRTKREFSPQFIPFQASGGHLMGSALLYLTRGSAQVYLIGGAGVLHTSVSSDFAGATSNPSANGFAINFGGGVKAFVTPRVSIRPEVRVFAGNSHGAIEPPFSDIRLSVGAGYHW
ncbi:MAG: outer membrane beta-barrel protein [Candidatus Solibacter sp.]